MRVGRRTWGQEGKRGGVTVGWCRRGGGRRRALERRGVPKKEDGGAGEGRQGKEPCDAAKSQKKRTHAGESSLKQKKTIKKRSGWGAGGRGNREKKERDAARTWGPFPWVHI